MKERYQKKFIEIADKLPLSTALVMIASIVVDYLTTRDDKILKTEQMEDRFAELEERLNAVDDKAGRALLVKDGFRS